MRRRLPPLNGLRAFEAAARHLSFVRAGDELGVTPGAVSHQVKALEDFLGVELFRRQPRGIRLSEAGQDVLPALRDAFDGLERIAEALDAHRSAGILVVSVAPTLAAKWLVPRLERFRGAHPEVDVRVDASQRVADFAREDVDVAIRYGAGVEPGLRAERLFPGREEVFPVCSPALLRAVPLESSENLARHVLLHAEWKVGGEVWPSWSRWLAAAGVEGVDATRGPRFTTWAMALQAAVEGHGVALGSTRLVEDELAAGRLVRPFDLALQAPAHFGFHVVCPEAAARRPKVAAFVEWALAEGRGAAAA